MVGMENVLLFLDEIPHSKGLVILYPKLQEAGFAVRGKIIRSN